MMGRTWRIGLFLATVAACYLAMGTPAMAAAPESAAQQALSTPQCKDALAKAGISTEQAEKMIKALTPDQRAQLERMAQELTPKSILSARMLSQGYTQTEVNERLASLTNDEIVQLAGNPDATVGGTNAGLAIAILCVVLAAILVTLYFTALEPGVETAPSAPAPAPAPAPGT